MEISWVDGVPGDHDGGPRASFFVLGDEVLRFDCFKGAAAHYHIHLKQVAFTGGVARFYFPPGSYKQHADRAAFELERNAIAACLITTFG